MWTEGGFSFTAAASTSSGTYSIPYTIRNGSATVAGTFTMVVTPAAPVFTVPAAETVNGTSALTLTGLAISDLYAGSSAVEMTLDVSDGTLSLSTSHLTSSSNQILGNGTSDLTVIAPVGEATYQGSGAFLRRFA